MNPLRTLGTVPDLPALLSTPREQVRPALGADRLDVWAMLHLWNQRSPACRDEALDMADRDRERASERNRT